MGSKNTPRKLGQSAAADSSAASDSGSRGVAAAGEAGGGGAGGGAKEVWSNEERQVRCGVEEGEKGEGEGE